MKQFLRRNNRLAFELAMVALVTFLLLHYSVQIQGYVSRLLDHPVSWRNFDVVIDMAIVSMFIFVTHTVGWQKLITRRLRYEQIWTTPIWSTRETRIAKVLQVASRILYVTFTAASVFVFFLVITEDLSRTATILKPYWWLFVFAAVWHGMWPWLNAGLEKIHAMFWAPRLVNWLVRKGLLYGLVVSLEFSLILGSFGVITRTSPKAIWDRTSQGVIRTGRSVTAQTDPRVCTQMVENHNYFFTARNTELITVIDAKSQAIAWLDKHDLVRFLKARDIPEADFDWLEIRLQSGTTGFVRSDETTCTPEYVYPERSP